MQLRSEKNIFYIPKKISKGLAALDKKTDTRSQIKEVNIEDNILRYATNNKASDIHFEPANDAIVVRIRINGDLIKYTVIQKSDYPSILSRIKVLSNMDIAEKRKPQDGSFTKIIDNNEINFRVSTILLNSGEKMVIRVIYLNKRFKSYKKLNFSNSQKSDIQRIIKVTGGLVLIIGPTGSGKTQTLYSIISDLKDKLINITSLEDPIEINLDGVNQVNVNKEAGISFKSALRSLVRQDSEVIIIGEIRDSETAAIAANASLTSHKIYATMHASNAYEAMLRLRDMDIDRYVLNTCISGIISQRLVKTLCDNCKIKYTLNSSNDKKAFQGNNKNGITLYKKCGCTNCNNTGYIGREMVSSVHYFNNKIRDNINDLSYLKGELTNRQMLSQIQRLLISGRIPYEDYIDFIQREEL